MRMKRGVLVMSDRVRKVERIFFLHIVVAGR